MAAWVKGQTGNPRGRQAGSRNKASLVADALLDGDAERLTRKAIEMALGGDQVAMRLCLDRITPPRKERPVRFKIPQLNTVSDAQLAVAAIAMAVSAGELTLSEGGEATRIVEGFTRIAEISEFGARLAALESANAQRLRPAP